MSVTHTAPDARRTSSGTSRAAGFAALGCAAAFIAGLALAGSALRDFVGGSLRLGEAAAFVVEHSVLLQVWYTVIYVAFAAMLFLLVLTLRDRLAPAGPTAVRAATTIGFAWCLVALAAGTVLIAGVRAVEGAPSEPAGPGLWWTVSTVAAGLASIEVLSGAWFVTVNLVGLRACAWPRFLAYAGVLVGVAGLLTLVPGAGSGASLAFGLGSVAWFIAVGIVLVRGRRIN